jgi:hypothetical protein
VRERAGASKKLCDYLRIRLALRNERMNRQHRNGVISGVRMKSFNGSFTKEGKPQACRPWRECSAPTGGSWMQNYPL